MEGTSIVRLFQNSEKIVKRFSIEINKIIAYETQKNEVNDYTERYIEIYRLFYSLFSVSWNLCGKISQQIIQKLEIVIEKTLSCWISLRSSTKMVKIHWIENNLLDQIKKYNGIGFFIEDFIE